MKNKSRQFSVEEIKSIISPEYFYEMELGKLGRSQRNGWRLAGLCPFHEDQNAGSFYVNNQNGAFKCFSCGNKGGDIIAFVQKKYDLSFLNAVQKLVDEWRAA